MPKNGQAHAKVEESACILWNLDENFEIMDFELWAEYMGWRVANRKIMCEKGYGRKSIPGDGQAYANVKRSASILWNSDENSENMDPELCS